MMMSAFARFPSPATLTVVAMLAAGGCQSVDHWTVFAPDWDRRMAEADRAARPVEPVGFERDDQRIDPLPAADVDGLLTISVEDAVFMALGRNRDLRVRQFGPVIAGTFEQIERGRFDPELFGEISASRRESSEVARATGSQFNVQARDAAGQVGLRQELPTGTTMEGTVSQGRTISNRAPEQQEARLGLTVTQALLQGFGPMVNLAAIEQARLEGLASRYELRGFAEVLAADAEIAYWNFVLALREITIFERSLEVARQLLDEVRQRIEVGDLAPTDAASPRAELAMRQQALIQARSRLEAQRVRLLRLLNPHDTGALDHDVAAVSDPVVAPIVLDDLPERLVLARQQRPDLSEARLRLDQNRLATIATRNGLLPRLDLFIALGKTGYGDTFPESFRELDGRTYDATAGVRLSHMLGNRAAEGRDLAARASRQQAAAAVENLSQLIELDVRLAWTEVERARQQIHATAASVALQEETLRAEQERFRVGASTSFLVGQAQRDLLAAQIAEVDATVAYRIALVNLHLAEGSLLARRGIRVADEF